MSTSGRRSRSAATVVVLAALLAGSAWGDDRHFPFGPLRMYSTTTRPSGAVNLVRLQARTSSGAALELRASDFGLRPAEMLGQVPAIEADPSRLRYLGRAYESAHPEAASITYLRLYFISYRLDDGRPVAIEEQEVARWRW